MILSRHKKRKRKKERKKEKNIGTSGSGIGIMWSLYTIHIYISFVQSPLQPQASSLTSFAIKSRYIQTRQYTNTQSQGLRPFFLSHNITCDLMTEPHRLFRNTR